MMEKHWSTDGGNGVLVLNCKITIVNHGISIKINFKNKKEGG